MTVYYNENDPRLTPWLYELMAAGVIAPGVVDTRGILDVRPGDLAPYTQCHFFAGIGVWSYALRLAGWPDDRPVWTGSCPCQPFSAAGKGAGFDDERHLWPAWFQLIAQRRPDRVYGEQVASKDGLAWLDLVHADLEAAGYSCGPVDLCAAGVGAPHIRQRLWFVAESEHSGRPTWHAQGAGAGSTVSSGGAGGTVADDDDAYGRSISGEARLHDRGQPGHDVAGRGAVGHALADAERSGLQVRGDVDLRGADGRSQRGLAEQPRDGGRSFWADCDWIPCRDGKARPVEPGAFPLAHGAPGRVVRLRAYGNAIVAEAAAEMIRATLP